mgnify:CR=1 FL=1
MNLLIRNWIDEHDLVAYSLNFVNIDRSSGFECVPFVEACKSMARGIGFAGERDILTASLCGALLKVYPETSFTEMFCPDWKGNSIFLSHMGEMNELTANHLAIVYRDVIDSLVAFGSIMKFKVVTI